MKVLFTYFCLHILRVSQQEPGAEFFPFCACPVFSAIFISLGHAAEIITVEIRPASEIVGVACISVYPVLPLVYVKIVL